MAEPGPTTVAHGPEPEPPAPPVSWLSLLRTARAPLAVVFLAGLALVVPPQSRDMLAALLDGRSLLLGPTFAFYCALAALTFSGWYWARALISARFDVPNTPEGRARLLQDDSRIDPLAFDVVPWIVFVLSGLLGLGLIIRSSAWGAAWSLLLWLVTLVVAFVRRQAGGGPPRAPRRPQPGYRAIGRADGEQSTTELRSWAERIPVYGRLLIHRAAGGPWIAVPFIGFALLVFVWGAVASFVPLGATLLYLPLFIANIFPGPGAALICLSLIIAPLSLATAVADGFRIEVHIAGRPMGPGRPPVVLALLVCIAAGSWAFSLHTVRLASPPVGVPTVDNRKDLGEFFKAWAEACAPKTDGPVRPIIVAVSGGASRAAVWGAAVLKATEEASSAGHPAVFAVSSVSGGSLGVAGYMALLATLSDAERCASGGVTEKRKQQVRLLDAAPLGGDALGPLLAGALAVDIPRALLSPFAAIARMFVSDQPRGGDRAEAIERAFEGLWREPWTSAKPMPFKAPFLSLFYDDKAKIRAGMPLWIANGTDENVGGRLLTVPFSPKSWPFDAAGDTLSALAADVPISTAINNTARFAYLEPSGELRRYRADSSGGRSLGTRICDQIPWCDGGTTEIIDGGYFENEGLQTALDLAAWLEDNAKTLLPGREVQPIIVQVTADGTDRVTPQDLARWHGPADDPTKPYRALPQLQILAPLAGLYNVRGGHSAVLLRAARDKYGERFFHFLLPGHDGRDVPLNWVLSDETTQFIRKDAIVEDQHSGNAKELDRLQKFVAR